MNKARRERLSNVLDILRQAGCDIEDVCDEEQDSIDGVPENLRLSDRCASMEEAVDCLEDAIECVHEAEDRISEAMNCG